MRRLFMSVAVAALGLGATRATGQTVTTFFADRDNFNSSLAGFQQDFNYGDATDFHIGRSNGHTQWYGDWSAADKTAMQTLLATPGPHTVELVFNQSNTNPGADTEEDITFTAFQSATDWVEGNGPQSGSNTFSGANHLFANDDKANNANDVAWNGVAGTTFLQLTGVTNTIAMDGWNGSLNAENRVQLDADFLAALLSDSTVRGIRANQFQDGGSARHQRIWSSEYAVDPALRPRIEITTVPEPTTLGLLGIGGLLLMRRRARRA